jgi:Domain of unknown function (DUF4389)
MGPRWARQVEPRGPRINARSSIGREPNDEELSLTRARCSLRLFSSHAARAAIIGGFFAVLFTGEYPEGIRGFVVSAYRYTLRVEAYVGFLTDRYPPFSLAA